ncbi:MAG: penicillin-binding protein 2 [Rhodospirillaceae bacterium]
MTAVIPKHDDQGDLFDFARDGAGAQRARRALETGRSRLLVTGLVIMVVFAALGWRVVDLTLFTDRAEPNLARAGGTAAPIYTRADVVDRNGIIVATSLPSVSLYADPKNILDVNETADKLVHVLPDLDRAKLMRQLRSNGRFVYLKRNLLPEQHFAVHRLGLPGIQFERGERRVYPQGRLLAHVLGVTNIDGHGTAGVERRFDQRLTGSAEPLALSIDVRLQGIAREELAKAVAEFQGIGGTAVVLDANTSELVAMVSLPDFDPNRPVELLGDAGFNRATKGVYEMGSTFKVLTAAMALDAGVVPISGGYDASKPLKVARETITDYHAKNRWLSVPEILIHSSNIGAAKMALDLGSKAQQTYLGRLGLLRPSPVELPEVGRPLYPARWREINTVTISYGYGISVTPLQLTNAIAAVVNGGIYRPTTVLRQDAAQGIRGEKVFSGDTSAKMRGLMRLVVSRGTGKNAEKQADGYLIGGKTGTAEKVKAGGYSEKANIASFIGAFPIHAPKYVIAVMVDEPKGNKKSFGYATGGWVAAPSVGRIVQRLAGVMGIGPEPGMPRLAAEEDLAAYRDPGSVTGPLKPAAHREIAGAIDASPGR